MIKSDIMYRSLSKAQDIFNISPNLVGVGAEVDYDDRDKYLQELVGAEGCVTFHPEVTDEILEPFRKMLSEATFVLRNAYYAGDDSADKHKINRFRFYLADMLTDRITVDSMIKNRVPKSIADWLNEAADPDYSPECVIKAARQYKSPKLSKLLVKLFGEQSEVVKWYTCKCPKSLTKGLLSDWNITVSILPHHIAGMSYYGSYNHGGKRWKEGYEGTSCMDTERNGKGSGIFGLVPSMQDTTMAIAYLSHASDTDTWNPIYQARCLLRVVHVHGQPHMIACRAYYISNEATHILIDGLKNKFGNVHFVREMREFRGDTDYVEFKHEFDRDDIQFPVCKEIECQECDGEGNFGYDDYGNLNYCGECDGDGTWHVDGNYLPYIDDKDFIDCYSDKMVFKLPTAYFESVGVQLKREVKAEETVEEVAAAPVSYARVDNANCLLLDFEDMEHRVIANEPGLFGIVDPDYNPFARGLDRRIGEGVVGLADAVRVAE